MKRFLNFLQDKTFSAGESLESEALIVAQKVLFNYGLPAIPRSYADFLKEHNGLKANGAYLFGATVDDELDIIDKNLQMPKPENTLLLGYNEFDILVYNQTAQRYQIVDRYDFKVLDSYSENEIDAALLQIFNV